MRIVNCYKDIKYKPKEKNIIDNYELSFEEEGQLFNILEKTKGKKINCVVRDIYILYLNDYSTEDLAVVYSKTRSTFNKLFKEWGIERDRFEAQRIAKKKRDYNQIAISRGVTASKRAIEKDLFGSRVEEYTRHYINNKLQSLGVTCVVGLNNKSLGLESDIPIVVFKEDEVLKYVVEVDGHYTHIDSESDKRKDKEFKMKGFTPIRVNTKSYYSDEKKKIVYKNHLINECDKVAKIIYKETI